LFFSVSCKNKKINQVALIIQEMVQKEARNDTGYLMNAILAQE